MPELNVLVHNPITRVSLTANRNLGQLIHKQINDKLHTRTHI